MTAVLEREEAILYVDNMIHVYITTCTSSLVATWHGVLGTDDLGRRAKIDVSTSGRAGHRRPQFILRADI